MFGILRIMKIETRVLSCNAHTSILLGRNAEANHQDQLYNLSCSANTDGFLCPF